MNKNLIKTGLCAFLVLGSLSCSEDDDPNNVNPGGNNAPAREFHASVDGEAFKSSETLGASMVDGTFNITATEDSSGESISITVSNASEGTFDIGGLDAVALQNGAVYMEAGSSNAFLAGMEGGSGEIQITEIDEENKTVTGTFSFTAVRSSFDSNGDITLETVEVTGGAFTDIPYIADIPGNPENSFSVKIDGTPLDADSVTAVDAGFGGESNITISAINNSTNQSLGMVISGNLAVGEYEFSAFGDYQAIYIPDLENGSTTYVADSGTLTITAYDPSTETIEGEFSFTAENIVDPNDTKTYAFSEGSFSVTVVQ